MCANVNGTICDADAAPASAATVRLMPSTAIEPLRITYGASGRHVDLEPVAVAVRPRARRRGPTPSTCPSTKCPPSRASARSGRSRLTRPPGARSAERRHAQRLRRDVRREARGVARRHREAHAVDGDAVAGAQLGAERRGDAQRGVPCRGIARARSRPVASISPVNIEFHQQSSPSSVVDGAADRSSRIVAAQRRAGTPSPSVVRRHDAAARDRPDPPRRTPRAARARPRRAARRRRGRPAARARRRASRSSRRLDHARRAARARRAAPGRIAAACADTTIMTGPAARVENTRALGRHPQPPVEDDARQRARTDRRRAR